MKTSGAISPGSPQTRGAACSGSRVSIVDSVDGDTTDSFQANLPLSTRSGRAWPERRVSHGDTADVPCRAVLPVPPFLRVELLPLKPVALIRRWTRCQRAGQTL